MLKCKVELVDESTNGTQQDAVDRENIPKEVNSLKYENDRIFESTNFNSINFLEGFLVDESGFNVKKCLLELEVASTISKDKNGKLNIIDTAITGKDTLVYKFVF